MRKKVWTLVNRNININLLVITVTTSTQHAQPGILLGCYLGIGSLVTVITNTVVSIDPPRGMALTLQGSPLPDLPRNEQIRRSLDTMICQLTSQPHEYTLNPKVPAPSTLSQGRQPQLEPSPSEGPSLCTLGHCAELHSSTCR